MIKKILLFILGLFIGILFFMPKDNLFFTAQKYLKSYNAFINFKHIDNSLFYLTLSNVDIFYKDMKAIKIDEVKMTPFILFNQVTFKNLKIANNNFKLIKANYNILHPLKIIIKGFSNLGKIDGYLNLESHKLKIYILDSKNKELQKMLKKDKKGYFYEQTF